MAKMLWDLECAECGFFNEDVFCTNYDIEQKRLTCANCNGSDLFKVIAIANIVGAREDKPVIMENIGKRFTSQRELQKFEKETGTYAATPSETKEHIDKKKRRVDDLARSRGYKNLEDYQSRVRERKADRESVGQKIIST